MANAFCMWRRPLLNAVLCILLVEYKPATPVSIRSSRSPRGFGMRRDDSNHADFMVSYRGDRVISVEVRIPGYSKYMAHSRAEYMYLGT